MREIAARYVERYGAALRRELAGGSPSVGGNPSVGEEPAAAGDGPRTEGGWTEIARREPGGRRVKKPAAAAAEPRGLTASEELDERILRGAARLRAARTTRRLGVAAALIAAVAAFAVLTPQSLGLIRRGIFDIFGGIIGADSVMSGGQAANMTGDTQAAAATQPQTVPVPQEPTGAGTTAAAATTAAPALSAAATTTQQLGMVRPGEIVTMPPEIIPLGFTPPSGFTAAGLDQDIDRTIYFYADAHSDNVVISLRYGGLDADPPEGYERIVLNGVYDAYAAYNADYSALTFERAGVVYELTCRYDMNTLLGFCDNV